MVRAGFSVTKMSSPWGLCSLARFSYSPLSFYRPLFFLLSLSFFLLTLFFFLSLSLSLSRSLSFYSSLPPQRHFAYLFFILVFPFVHIRIHIPPGTHILCQLVSISLLLFLFFLRFSPVPLFSSQPQSHSRTHEVYLGLLAHSRSLLLFLFSSLLSCLSLSLSLTSLSLPSITLSLTSFFFCNPRQFKKEHFHVCIVQLLLSITQHYIHIHTHPFSISFPTPASASKLSHPCLSACLLLIVILFCMLTASLFNGCILVSLFVGAALDHNCLLALLGRQE
ncbi:hypothetical protein F5H01DRAFT_179770 [Linnemannia elongata]|nr:hypothetical protein F5H01DRAFT_179770 [Linnemannia elongata]